MLCVCGEGHIEYFQEETTYWDFDEDSVDEYHVDLETQLSSEVSPSGGSCGFVCTCCSKEFTFDEIIALRDSRLNGAKVG